MRDTTTARLARAIHRGKALAAIALIILATLALFPLHVPLSPLLFNLTGEESPIEQVKGVGALLLLKLIQPPVETHPYTPMAHAGLNPYGINTFLEQEAEEAKVRRSLQMIHDAGFRWIRQEFPWEDIEIHGKGDFEDRRTEPHRSAWEKYDRIVELAEEYGIEILARLDNPPAWSRAAGDATGTLAPPDDFADYGDFVHAVVSRYRGRIKHIQIWNEPNIYPEWGEEAVDPEAYTELLKVGYARAKEADPNIVVVSAGLAPTLEMGPRNLSDLVFLERMYQAGARSYFDVLAVMGYGLWTGPTDRRLSPDRTNFSRPQLIRHIMVEHGDEAKPVWIMEMGWNAAPPELPAPFGRVTEEQQARYAVLAYQRVRDEWPWVGVVFTWFFKRADEQERDQPMYYFRLVDPDFTTHPVYGALRELATSPPMVPIGYHQEDHWALEVEGSWETVADGRAVQGAYRGGRQPGDSLRFTFQGTDLDLVVCKSEDGGRVRVSVDGEPVRVLDLRGRAFECGVEVPVAQGLSDGEHRVELVVDGEGFVALDGLLVRRTYDHLLRRILGGLAVMQALVGFGYLLWVARRSR